MFNNPFNRKYQTGGSAPTDEQRKEMEGFVAWLGANIEEFKGKSAEQIVHGISQKTKSGEKGKKEVDDWYSRYQKSKSKFADGGKFQDFICKHKRGGNVDCGCGGMKVVSGQEGIESIPTPKDSTVNKAGFVVYPAFKEILPTGEVVETAYGHDKDGQWVQRRRWSNGGYTYLGGYNDDGQFRKDGDIRYPASSEIARYFESPLARMAKYSKPESKEDGGVVSEQEGGELTRKQARILSRHNKGFNRGQFQLAMANADAALRQANPGLHGRELRQAKRRMVAGLNENPLATSATIESPILVAPSTGLVRSESVEAPKVNIAATQASSTLQRNSSTNRRSNIARREDYPMQEIVIPQISTNIPFGKGPRTSEKEITPVIEVGPLTETRDYQSEIYDAMHKFGPWVEWGQGGLQEETPKKVIVAPKRNYSIITGQALEPTQSSWDLYKQGGQIEKHQDDNGIIDHYRSKWANDWNNIKRGWNNFKDSALGLVVPTSGTDVALMAAGPMFKITGKVAKSGPVIEKVGDVGRKVITKTGKPVTIVPEGVYGSEKAARRALTESAPFISQKSELANEAARNINGLRKWLYGGWYNATTNLPK